MRNIFKFLGLIAIVAVIGFSMAACSSGGGGGEGEGEWWTWHSTVGEGGFNATAQVSITPTSDNTGCDVVVTGSPNDSYCYWASQVGTNYAAVAGRNYKVTWKWRANDSPFRNVTIRYAQHNDYLNDQDFEPDYLSRITIPTTEETKTVTFTMPGNCISNFTFMVGEDTGSFQIRDFKIEEITAIANEWYGTYDGGDGKKVTLNTNGSYTITGWYGMNGIQSGATIDNGGTISGTYSGTWVYFLQDGMKIGIILHVTPAITDPYYGKSYSYIMGVGNYGSNGAPQLISEAKYMGIEFLPSDPYASWPTGAGFIGGK